MAPRRALTLPIAPSTTHHHFRQGSAIAGSELGEDRLHVPVAPAVARTRPWEPLVSRLKAPRLADVKQPPALPELERPERPMPFAVLPVAMRLDHAALPVVRERHDPAFMDGVDE